MEKVTTETGDIPWWHVNVPVDQRTLECPEYLINASTRDRIMISTPDSQYQRPAWEDVQEFISRESRTPYNLAISALIPLVRAQPS